MTGSRRPTPSSPPNPLAPGWSITCPRCGARKPYPGFRLGAASIGERVLCFCRACGWFRMGRVERVPGA
ncbi:MAG: hypothetical protein IT438_05550 [Phycisphaerales bacterium]|nr:hypothetical protein [Phycisphaerales bacterium]